MDLDPFMNQNLKLVLDLFFSGQNFWAIGESNARLQP